MSSHTQQELNAIWTAIMSGKYGSDPTVIAPRRVAAEHGTDIMTIPNAAGTSLDVYERKNGGIWEEVPYVGQYWPKVKAALENPNFKWRTLNGIVKETGLDAATVSANLSNNTGTVVKSSISDPNNNDLFTTREHYLKKSSLLERLQSAITNRVQK